MVFHPTIPGLLVTGGAPNSRVTLWSIKEKTIEKQTTFNLQRVSLKKHLFQVGKKILNSLILETECIDMAFE